NDHAHHHTDESAPNGKHHGLDEKLHGDVLSFGAERAPDADLARALRHCRQHDVHDANAADHQRDHRDGTEHDVEAALGFFRLAQQLQRHDNLKVVLAVKMI